MWEAILETLIDSLKTLPILLVVYTLIELMEHKGSVKFEKMIASSKKFGPLWGAGLGCVPQCGFSAVMADLFSRKMITIGTLFAVFVATSDEAFAVLLSSPNQIWSLLALIGCKLVLAVVIGYLLDLIFRKENKNLSVDNLEHSTHFEHEHSHSHSDKEQIKTECCKECENEEKSCETCEHNHLHHHHELEEENKQGKGKIFWHICLQGLLHALQIFAIILVANVLITVVLELAGGEQALANILGTNSWYSPLICALIGLIPNCAGSCVLADLYINGMLSFASCLGGLCTGAGVGLLVLFKNKKNLKQNLFILLMLYLIGVIVGFVFNLFMPFHI